MKILFDSNFLSKYDGLTKADQELIRLRLHSLEHLTPFNFLDLSGSLKVDKDIYILKIEKFRLFFKPKFEEREIIVLDIWDRRKKDYSPWQNKNS